MDDFLHEELARTEGLSHIYNILRTEAYNNGQRRTSPRNLRR